MRAGLAWTGRRGVLFLPLQGADPDTMRTIAVVTRSGAPVAAGTAVTVAGRAHDLGIGYDGLLLVSEQNLVAPIRTGFCAATVLPFSAFCPCGPCFAPGPPPPAPNPSIAPAR